jgi:hypothetical protein
MKSLWRPRQRPSAQKLQISAHCQTLKRSALSGVFSAAAEAAGKGDCGTLVTGCFRLPGSGPVARFASTVSSPLGVKSVGAALRSKVAGSFARLKFWVP